MLVAAVAADGGRAVVPAVAAGALPGAARDAPSCAALCPFSVVSAALDCSRGREELGWAIVFVFRECLRNARWLYLKISLSDMEDSIIHNTMTGRTDSC